VAGADNPPAGITSANVILVFGNDKASKLSHVAACDSETNRTIDTLKPHFADSWSSCSQETHIVDEDGDADDEQWRDSQLKPLHAGCAV
jgi:hypothetical protein